MRLGRILKYTLTLEAEQRLVVPAGSRVLDVQMQSGVPTVWLLTETPHHPSHPAGHVEWLIRVVGTGWEVWGLDEWTHLGTVQDRGSWHVFRQEGS